MDTSSTESQDRKPRFPAWLRGPMRFSGRSREVRKMLADLKLNTVCSSALCPNIGECFSSGTATFMILGTHCTRACRFCAIDAAPPEPVRPDEPTAVAEAAVRLKLRHVVITSVTRDDLPDGGSGHFARTCDAVRVALPQSTIEILTPDFQGRRELVEAALAGRPDVFNHNVETVPRLYSQVRPGADYRRSLEVLRWASQWADSAEDRADSGEGQGRRMLTKSGVMVGLGETRDELTQVMRDLREVGCEAITIGQYLAPSPEHFPIARFVEPAEFDSLADEARSLGFRAVASAPLVRSSYNAAEMVEHRPETT